MQGANQNKPNMSDLTLGQIASINDNSFLIQSLLGEGGYSRVFKVSKVISILNGQYQTESKDYALKVSYCNMEDKQTITRLTNELSILVKEILIFRKQ